MNKVIKAAAVAALVFSVAAPVSAASFDLSFTGYHGSSDSYSYGDGQTLSVIGLTSYWNNDGYLQRTGVTQNSYYGLYTDGGTHGISNSNGTSSTQNQMLLLDFGQVVSLDAFTLSWGSKGGNAPNYGSVLAYTSDESRNLGVLRWGDLLTSGFEHAGDVNAYKDLIVGQETSVQGDLLSRYWLIGAINPIFGGDTDRGRNDAFKLGSISFSTMDVSEVPLPAAAWLFLTGLAGMSWMKKRKQKREQLALAVAA